MQELGFNYHPNNMVAALGISQLSTAEASLQHRNGTALKCVEAFNGK